MAETEDQQFCLRWNNFQANITSQFETLRDDEDFTDVTIACDGQRLQAHKVVLSACSPYFKELFKNNPCSHPIIFMRDVEARHVVALMEFMYAGEVNVAQAHLSGFLKTAESLKIRGLTDTATTPDHLKEQEESSFSSHPTSSKQFYQNSGNPKQKSKFHISSSSTVTSSQDFSVNSPSTVCSPPPSKRQCKPEKNNKDLQRLRQLNVIEEDSLNVNQFNLQSDCVGNEDAIKPKMELPDYLSDDEREDAQSYFQNNDDNDLTGGMEIIPQMSSHKDLGQDASGEGPLCLLKRRLSDPWMIEDNEINENPSEETASEILQRLHECRDTQEEDTRNRLVKLAEGIEIYEEQLRSVKWSDYRKLTRGLATILFSPAELATCSVTGQRWSRAGSGERPVKPALDRAKVQAIISYVATRFPMVEISRIKQVLAYKCKENSTAFKMKAVRFYGEQIREANKQ